MKYSLLKMSRSFLVTILLLSSFLSLSSEAQAQVVVTDGFLTAEFESVPLFGSPDETNFAPSSSSSKSVIITNNGTAPESVIVSVTNEFSTGLAEVVTLTITDSNTSDVYFNDTMSNFFLNIPVDLGVLNAGDSRLYKLDTKFVDAGDNTYQGTTMGFDIHFGFDSGASVTPDGDGGGGGGSTSGSSHPSAPSGQVAGASTSTSDGFDTVPSWWSPFTDWIGTMVLGASATNDHGSTTEDNDSKIGDSFDTTVSDDSGPNNVISKENCLLTWLLLLSLIALVAGSVDYLSNQRDKVFRNLYIKHILFLAVYIALVGIAFIMSWLDNIWYLLAGAWVVIQIADYRLHSKEWMVWKPFGRLLAYGICGLIFIGTALLFDWPCVWWPFTVIVIASLVTYIVGER